MTDIKSADFSAGVTFLGKQISAPFTIPSGIVATAIPIIEYIFREIPQIGVMTTKSIGPVPRLGNREPVYSQYAPGCFVNAVGLTNPGAERSAELFAELAVPQDRFLLISIFGGSVQEFVDVARILAPFADGLELNLSCPHAEGYGMAMGQDPSMVQEITQAVKEAVSIPVVPKLTPNVDNIAIIAEAAVAGGADALCAINTLGPGYFTAHGSPVLSNGLGGMSGKGVVPIALKCVADIAATVDVPIIGCGGISSADDVRAFADAGADIFGVGSALTGLTSPQITSYFQLLLQDLQTTESSAAQSGNPAQSDSAGQMVRYDVDMDFHPVVLQTNRKVCEDIVILEFDRKIDIKAGEFVFLWIPGVGEKPFSALTDDPFSLVVINVGEFTDALMSLQPGTDCYVRGPYGIPAAPPSGGNIVAVAGGTGLAAVYQLVRDFGGAHVFVGARSAERLYYLDECIACAEVHVATDDGSMGYHGLVTEHLRDYLAALDQSELDKLVFYNCGPAPMVLAAEAVQKEFCQPQQIHSAIDYLTKCGVGVCGACTAPDGRRLCVDGPFLQALS
ncbi:MAG: tRNA-dihydrouridine synthase [Pseudomonadales bacterium]